jgi:hypothetical protein
VANPPIGNRFISEWHKDIVKAVPALPAPSAALAGFRRFRTSDNIEYYCDGTRWLSTSLYSWSGPAIAGITVTTTNNNITDFNEDVYSIYLTKFVFISIMVGGTYNSTNTWTVQLRRQDDTAALSNIGSAVDIWQVGRVTGRRYHNTLTINAVYAPATTKLFLMDITKVGAAGSYFSESPTLWYRLIAS